MVSIAELYGEKFADAEGVNTLNAPSGCRDRRACCWQSLNALLVNRIGGPWADRLSDTRREPRTAHTAKSTTSRPIAMLVPHKSIDGAKKPV